MAHGVAPQFMNSGELLMVDPAAQTKSVPSPSTSPQWLALMSSLRAELHEAATAIATKSLEMSFAITVEKDGSVELSKKYGEA